MCALPPLDVGQLLMVELQQELLVGRLKYIEPGGKVIELEKVRDLKTNYTYTSSHILALPQIKAIKVINEDNEPQTLNDNSDNVKNKTSALPSAQTDMPLSDTELQTLQAHLQSAVLIVQADQSYHKAMADLKRQTTVSLVAYPADCQRHRRMSLLALATPYNVYIFDMLALGKMLHDLRVLLQAEQPRKAVHRGCYLADHLQHRFDVHLNGIFDTFVAFCYVNDSRQPVSLVDAIQRTFNISEIYFQLSSDEKLPADVYQRPVPLALRQLLAKQAIFQLKLHDHLLHKSMLAKFYKQCSNFVHTFSENPDSVDVAMQMHSKPQAGMEHLDHVDDLRQILELDFDHLKMQ